MKKPNRKTNYKKYDRTIPGLYRTLKKTAKRRHIPMKLSLEEFKILRSYPCVYCGSRLSEAGYSLDRLDPSGPYSKENVVAACWPCNNVKSNSEDRLEVMLFGAIKRILKAYSELKDGSRRKKNSI